MSPSTRIPFVVLLTVGFLNLGSTLAGDLTVSWDPSPSADGYVVHYGPGPDQYTFSVDVGNVTETSIDGLDDCTAWYFAATAHNENGTSGFSNEDSSWPRAVITSVVPPTAEQGSEIDLVLGGVNLQAGSTVRFTNAHVAVSSVSVGGCGLMTVRVTVGAGAPTGPADVEVTHPGGDVTGVGAGLFSVTPAVPPVVVSTSPADGATGVGSQVEPTVGFSEALRADSVTAATVRLVDEDGTPVSQRADSPRLSADGRTITILPAAALADETRYWIQVVGGPAGVRDLAGHAMASTFVQTQGFETEGAAVEPPEPPENLILTLWRSLREAAPWIASAVETRRRPLG